MSLLQPGTHTVKFLRDLANLVTPSQMETLVELSLADRFNPAGESSERLRHTLADDHGHNDRQDDEQHENRQQCLEHPTAELAGKEGKVFKHEKGGNPFTG